MFFTFIVGSFGFAVVVMFLCLHLLRRDPFANYGRRRHIPGKDTRFPRTPPKPSWVRREVLKLKALMPEAGCRTLACVFNRRHAGRNMTVGKSFVHDLLRRHQYEIRILRRQIKTRPPRPVPRNLIWGVDLTGKADRQGHCHTLLGIVAHHSRACLLLTTLREKSSIALLRAVLGAAERFGRPAILRSDNEGVFTSRLFRLGLWLLDIRHQRTDPACPWQNGRIERFFGTLKSRLDAWDISNSLELARTLRIFRFWYNHVRPHQAVNGRTPAETWCGDAGCRRSPGRRYWFSAMDGLLVGDFHAPG